jgi:hypothetical protein
VHSSHRRTVRAVRSVVVAILTTVAAVSFTPNSVAADDYGYSNLDGNGPVPVPDSQDHWFCFASVPEAAHRTIIRGSMSFLDDSTNMYDVESSSCGASTDVWFRTQALASGALGLTTCQSWTYWSVCDRYNVYLEKDAFISVGAACDSSADVIEFNYVHTVRHEIGHTAGLHHVAPYKSVCTGIAGSDAMSSDWVNTNWLFVTYSQHHVNHVNCVCD